MGFNQGNISAPSTSQPQLNVPKELQGPQGPQTPSTKNQLISGATEQPNQVSSGAVSPSAAQNYPLQPKAFDYNSARHNYLNDPAVKTGDEDTDPNVWLKRASALDQDARDLVLVPTEASRTLATANNQIATQYRSRADEMIKAALAPQVEAGNAAQKKIADFNLDKYQSQQQAALEANNRSQQADQALNAVFNKDGSLALQTGPVADKLHNLAGTLENLGVSPDWISRNIQDPVQFEKLAKQAPALATEIARQSLGGNQLKVTEFNQFMKGVPDTQILPETIKYLVNQNIKPQAKLEVDTWNHIKDMNPSIHDVAGEISSYKLSHPWLQQEQNQSTQTSASTQQSQQQQQAQAELMRRQAAAELARRQASSGNQ
jgi:predicted HAD superfamily Cof-like phosphohydrolase